MAQDNEYVQKLIAARDREVAHRRDVARILAEKQNREVSENIREAFINDPKSEPFSPFGFRSAP
jgi:hypothetical protein